MKYKNLYIGMIILLILPMVAAEEYVYFDTPVEIKFVEGENNVVFEITGEWDPSKGKPIYKYKIEYDNNSTNLNILKLNTTIGEYYNLNKTTDNVLVALKLTAGEHPDIVIDTCSKYLDNVTSASKRVNTYRDKYDKLFEAATNMVNKTIHDEIEKNLTTKYSSLESEYETYKSNKDEEIKKLQERNGDLERHRQWGWGIGIFGGVGCLYLLNKYRGLGTRKHGEQQEFPKDVSS